MNIKTIEQTIDTRNEHINEIVKDLEILNELNKELASIVNSQGENIDHIVDNIEQSKLNVNHGLEDIKKAKSYSEYFSFYKNILIVAVGGIIVLITLI